MVQSDFTQVDLVKVIAVNEAKCVNCHACIDDCPVKNCNDGRGNSVTINQNLCIACGACLSACTHDAQYFIDDFKEFINDIKNGEKIVVIADGSSATNYPNRYKNLNGWIKSLGIPAVFDSSFGAELMVMSYVNHIVSDEPKLVISQNCPAIVSYIEIYKPELLSFLAPVESSVLQTAKMIKEYFPKFKHHKIAYISPCAARKREFAEAGLVEYNISFVSINKYFERNKIKLSKYPEIEYDHEPTEKASLISSPGGLLRTMERWMQDIRGKVRIIEGPRIICNYFDNLYDQVKNQRTPLLIDCLNCEFGCNQGPLTIAQHHPVDEIEYWIERRNEDLHEYHRNEAGDERHGNHSRNTPG
ncbi:MAG: 4Fe-4S binding protein [Candidatus Marinimicrobia bacterium]|nr:4Fe-4S binding protein [Candidatus Neomarinimicrobiota bacterium]